MGWYEKETSTPFDTALIEGLFFLDGDIYALTIGRLTEGLKFPKIAFPSGLELSIWETDSPECFLVHVIDEIDLFLNDTRDGAYQHAISIHQITAHLTGRVLIEKVGDSQLKLFEENKENEAFLVTYDNANRRMINVEKFNLDKSVSRDQSDLHRKSISFHRLKA